ncbi:RluA family pseudouridine synthase [Acanthopleuribacter pedis]|uniref:RNA pseudouridine synthase n=1 Tax=Acanthopleuribacter pedis TaxID=442870 RepID=A0A8J7U1G0_9BACT|nr:RNA pseudouridine synthase [Acanthopleuribacter pedis]MBO1318138.1 RNA pseudouridine synthase [Acanthopleuribacter pedis]
MKSRSNLSVVYHDNHLLVVNKPAGLLSQADETGDIDLLTLAKSWVKDTYQKPGQVYLGLVHRLDRPASGLMVLARTSKAAARLTRQFQARTPHKRYWALLQGRLDGAGRWEDYLIKSGRVVSVVSQKNPKAKYAALRWRALAYHKDTTLVAVELETGRPHQIRVQFASRGFPLLGDLRYRATRRFDGENLALHCFQLGLEHPTRREPMRWEQDAPATWSDWFAEVRAAVLRDSSEEHG